MGVTVRRAPPAAGLSPGGGDGVARVVWRTGPAARRRSESAGSARSRFSGPGDGTSLRDSDPARRSASLALA